LLLPGAGKIAETGNCQVESVGFRPCGGRYSNEMAKSRQLDGPGRASNQLQPERRVENPGKGHFPNKSAPAKYSCESAQLSIKNRVSKHR